MRAAAVLAATAAIAAPMPGVAQGPAALTLRPGPHLFLDDRLIERAEGVRRSVHSPRRTLSGPVVTGPEDRNFQPYVTVLRDGPRFRMWYNTPESASQSHLGYLESADGVRWERPHRVLPDPGGPIQFGAAVVDAATRDAPAERFKLAFWHDGGLKLATSGDGLSWKPFGAGVAVPHNHDINSLHWDPIRRHYLALVSLYGPGPTWKGQRRHTAMSTSKDLRSWEPVRPILTPDDARDPGETQFYCMSGVAARGDTLVGMLKVLRDDLPANPPDGPTAGLGYTVLAWSHDGRTWTRDSEPFLDRAPRREDWDRAMSWGDCQLLVGDEVFLYYGGYRQGHKLERFTERQIGLVRFKRDRYVARSAGFPAGTLRTPLVALESDRLTLNAAAGGGEVRVQALGPDGRPLAGFGFGDCTPITADGVDLPVRWRGGTARDLRGRSVRLEFRLRGASLFALNL
jgi:hypothetical protein